MAEKVKLNPIQVEQPVDITMTQGKVDSAALQKQLQNYVTKGVKGRGKGLEEILRSATQDPSLWQSSYGKSGGYTKFTKFPELVKPQVQNPIGTLDREIMKNLEQPLQKIISGFMLKPMEGSTELDKSQYTMAKRLKKLAKKFSADTGSEKDLDEAYTTVNALQKTYKKWFKGAKNKTPELQSAYENEMRYLVEAQDLFKNRARVKRDHKGQAKTEATLEQAKQELVDQTVLAAANAVKETAKRSSKGKRSTAKTSNAEVLKLFAEEQLMFGFGGGSFHGGGGGLTALGGAADEPPKRRSQRRKAIKDMVADSNATMQKASAKINPLDMFNFANKVGMDKATAAAISGTAGDIQQAFASMRTASVGTTVGANIAQGLSKALVGGITGSSGLIIGGIVTVLTAALFGVVAVAGGLAAKITQAIVTPIIQGFQMGFEKAGATSRALSLAMYPLIGRGQDVQAAFKGIATPIAELAHVSFAPLDALANMEQRFVRITGTTKGLKDYMRSLLQYSALTGEEVRSIDDSFLEIAQFFNVDLTSSAGSLAKHMTNVALATNATSQEIRQIAEWLMPSFANAVGTSEEKMQKVLTMSGKLAQVGLKQPRQLVQFTSMIEQFMTPSTKELEVLAALGTVGNIFETASASAQATWNQTFTDISTKLKDLMEQEETIRSSGIPFAEIKKAVEPLEAQTTALMEELQSAFESGLSSGMTGNADKLISALNAGLESSSAWVQHFSRTSKGSMVPSIRAMVKALKEEVEVTGLADKAEKQRAQDLGLMWEEAKNAQNTFFQFAGLQLFSPIQLSGAKSLRSIFQELNQQYADFINKKPGTEESIWGTLTKLGTQAGKIFDKDLAPAMDMYGDYLGKVLQGGDTKGLPEAIQEKFKAGITALLDLVTPLIAPVVESLTDTFLMVFSTVLTSQLGQKLVAALKGIVTGVIQSIMDERELITSAGESVGDFLAEGLKNSQFGLMFNLANMMFKQANKATSNVVGAITGPSKGTLASADAYSSKYNVDANIQAKEDSQTLASIDKNILALVHNYSQEYKVSGQVATSTGSVGVSGSEGIVTVMDQGQETIYDLAAFLQKYFKINDAAIKAALRVGAKSLASMQAEIASSD